MEFTIQIFQIIFYSVGIIFMSTVTFISIWAFITFNKLYKNHIRQISLLDKIYQGICNLNVTELNKNKDTKEIFDIDEEELFNNDTN